MPHRDQDWDTRGGIGEHVDPDATDVTPAPSRRASRHARHTAEEPAPVPGDDMSQVEEEPPRPERRQHRTGRDLPAAVAVGVLLGAAVLASLFVWRPAFVIVVVLAVAVGTWEMTRAVRSHGPNPPLVPLLAGGMVMIGLAWFGSASVLPLGLMATALAVLVWRLGDGAPGYQRDVTAAVLIATYVPFLASFAVLLAKPADGDLRVLATLLGIVISDTAGFATGVMIGRHPMAPSVSPKKSWEGFAGSVSCAMLGEALILLWLFEAAWWEGALFGLAVSAASVLGDLAESLLKRDLGVKDMSKMLPGHGGLMDRLDSILLAAPVAYAVLSFVVPVAP